MHAFLGAPPRGWRRRLNGNNPGMARLSWRYRLMKLLERLRERDAELEEKQKEYTGELRDYFRRRRPGK